MIVIRGFGTIGACTVGAGNGFGTADVVQMVYNASGAISIGHRAGIGSAVGVHRGSYDEKHYK